MQKGTGERKNEGKTRHDLVPTFAQEEYAKVLTLGAQKYAERNWENGMKWSKVLASLERHLQKIKNGEDYDKETGLLHSAHVMCNAAFLTEYYKVYPEGDDRPHNFEYRKIGLDIDEVLADFIGGFYTRFKNPSKSKPKFWNDPFIGEHFDEIKDDYEFWLNLPVLNSPEKLSFEPTCYITSRSIPSEISREWLLKNGFPDVPVYTVGIDGSKLDIAKKAGIDYFVDDRYKNFVELTNAGIFTYLYSQPHNERYNVGFRRIKCLTEI